MVRMLVALTLSGAMAGVAAWLVLSNAYPDEGPWLPISPSHGIHIGDVVIVLLWTGATWALVHWARSRRSRAGDIDPSS